MNKRNFCFWVDVRCHLMNKDIIKLHDRDVTVYDVNDLIEARDCVRHVLLAQLFDEENEIFDAPLDDIEIISVRHHA